MIPQNLPAIKTSPHHIKDYKKRNNVEIIRFDNLCKHTRFIFLIKKGEGKTFFYCAHDKKNSTLFIFKVRKVFPIRKI